VLVDLVQALAEDVVVAAEEVPVGVDEEEAVEVLGWSVVGPGGGVCEATLVRVRVAMLAGCGGCGGSELFGGSLLVTLFESGID